MSSPIQSWLELPDGSRFDLAGSVEVGRSQGNALVLDHEEISRRHAILQAQGEREFWIVDLGSANGTYVNGRRIAQPVQLHDGDVIRLSAAELIFHNEFASAMHPVGQHLMAASTMLSVTTSECWMMMADIIGSTRLSQQVSPEELPRITGGWFKACREVIETHGGHIMKYLGDGFFCYWEAKPETAELIRAALATLAPMQAQGTPPFRIILHHGSVVLGSVPTMAELNLHGPQVNFAFRIEKVAAALKLNLMLSEAANTRLGLPTRLVHSCSVEGFGGAFQFYSPELPRA